MTLIATYKSPGGYTLYAVRDDGRIKWMNEIEYARAVLEREFA